MAIIRDGMPPFELYQPASLDDALDLAKRLGKDAWILAGGLDSLERFKDRLKRPKAVIDLCRVDGLRGVRKEGEAVVIGPMTTLAEIAGHPLIRERYALLAEAASEVASPQIRNQGTIGGNISQDARCWYYRGGWACYRAGGNICYADSPEGMNREHAIFGAAGCVAVSPSDTAPALIALEARFTVQNGTAKRDITAEDFFVGPDQEITRMTVLGPGDILTGISLPGTWAKAAFHFEKVRDRPVWDFALASIAAAMRLKGGRVEAARFALGAVAARPWRMPKVEEAVKGLPRAEAAAVAARLAGEGAEPLARNGYKLTLARNLVKRAIAGESLDGKP